MQPIVNSESAARVDKNSFVRMELDIRWQSETAEHREMFLARRSNVWRDIFPPGLEDLLVGCRPGDCVEQRYAAGEVIPPYRRDKAIHRKDSQFQPALDPKRTILPRFGRFYPKGLLLNVLGIYPQNRYPFRVIDREENEGGFTADLNHPMALFPIEVRVRILEVALKDSDVGGRLTSWMDEILDLGPGMQARWKGKPTDFWSPEGFRRQDEGDDADFHARPRLVGHVDSQASAFIQEEYENHLRPGMKVLDLMSSMESHLPENMDLEITGLGMNREELAANPRLSDFLVQDLNKEPQLPFPEGHFDVAVCSLSIEYLVRPLEVLRELSRVLKPGGRCLVSFSDRWHAPKAIALWSELNEFERMGLVQEYFLKSGGFEGVRTFSRRNWWRPETDSYYGRLPASDPVYMVTAAAVETGSARNDPSTP